MTNVNHMIIAIFSIIVLLLIAVYYYKKKYRFYLYLPKRFLLEDEQIIEVVKSLRRMMNIYCKKVYIEMSKVDNLSHEAFMILMAQGEKTYYNKNKTIYLKSVSSCSKDIINIIMGKNKNHKTFHSYVKLRDSNVPFFQSAQINPKITAEAEAELKRMGIKNYYEFNTLLTELLGNAIEHGIKKRNINWWLYQYRDRETQKMSFAFADMGVGIIDSYKQAGLPSQYKHLDDKGILLHALEGKLGSSTKSPNRGRGLPQLRHMIVNKWISDFVLITNSVSLRYINDSFTIKSHPNFVGTYYSWTINKENYIAWKRK